MSGVFSDAFGLFVGATGVTGASTVPRDIPEDFVIALSGLSGIEVQIPNTARYLFVAPINQTPGGASDQDGNYALRIESCTVPEGGQTALLMITAILAITGYGWRDRRARKELV